MEVEIEISGFIVPSSSTVPKKNISNRRKAHLPRFPGFFRALLVDRSEAVRPEASEHAKTVPQPRFRDAALDSLRNEPDHDGNIISGEPLAAASGIPHPDSSNQFCRMRAAPRSTTSQPHAERPRSEIVTSVPTHAPPRTNTYVPSAGFSAGDLQFPVPNEPVDAEGD